MKNLVKYIAFAVLFGLLMSTNIAYAADSSQISLFKLQAYGIDTIAGYSANIYSSRTLPDKNVVFGVQKPDGTVLNIPAVSDASGVAEVDLYDYHTKEAGTYKVTAKLEGTKEGEANTFIVYADEVSPTISLIEASKLLAKSDGADKIYITVTLTDKNSNPINNHSVEIISSRSFDTIQKITKNGLTDKNGSIMFAVSSKEKGISIYSFLDTTSNIVLSKRLELAYSGINNAGGFIDTAYAAAGEVSKLVFENLPSTIVPNSDVSFKLSAYDSEDTIVPNYIGQVHFSAEGSNSVYAKVPNDYTFDVDIDGGTHTFSAANGLNFSEPGIYTVVATDLDNAYTGEVEITVGTGSQTQQGQKPKPSANDAIITSPTAGTYGDPQLPISGSAPTGSVTIQIFDNDQSIGTTSVESDNSFTYQPTILADGEHNLFVVAVEADGAIVSTSADVKFSIDTTPPKVESIKFTPSTGIKTGDVIDIIVVSSPDVFQGAVVFNVDIAELEQDPTDPTHYLASIQAPAEAGKYPIDVVLVDELENEGSYTDVATVEVNANGEGAITGNIPETTPPTTEPTTPVDAKPGDVFGVTSASSDTKVTLAWQPSTDDKGVKNYKIYYGLSAANLNNTVNTFDNKTTWYIPNLQNGSEFFFAVSAVDTNGQESANKSSIVSGIPFSSAPILYIPPETTPPEQVRPTAPTMQATGPEVVWFMLASVFFAKLYFNFRKKVC